MSMMKFDKMWQVMSTNVLDTAVRFQPIRNWALDKGKQQLYHKFVVDNKMNLPEKVQELRCVALTNLLHSVSYALNDGRISPGVRRGIVKNFIGQVVVGEGERMRPFREEHGFDPPTFLTISPTKKCNLRCKGCYAASTAKDHNKLSYEVFDRIIKEKRDLWGSHFTVISGGEPLMYRSDGKDLFDILRDNQDSYFMMYTNATLIDRETARKMAEVGNITPAISVEGWEKETDDRRGKGVFRKIQQAMDNLRAEGVPFGVSVTATRDNAEVVLSEEFQDYYFNQKGAIYGWIFQYMPIGRSFTIDMMVTPEQRQWMLEQELKLIYDKKLFLIDFWNGGPMSVGCIAAGRSGGYFYIDWDGNVAPCVFFPYGIANVNDLYHNDKTLNDVLLSDYFKAIRGWQEAYTRRKYKGKFKMKNLFRPCPIRDHYDFAYRAINYFDTEPMDLDARKALLDENYRKRLLNYDSRIKELLDPMWEERIYGNGTKMAQEEEKKAREPVNEEVGVPS